MSVQEFLDRKAPASLSENIENELEELERTELVFNHKTETEMSGRETLFNVYFDLEKEQYVVSSIPRGNTETVQDSKGLGYVLSEMSDQPVILSFKDELTRIFLPSGEVYDLHEEIIEGTEYREDELDSEALILNSTSNKTFIRTRNALEYVKSNGE